MNTVDALNAVAIQAPSSKLMPRCPLKSASASERRRAARLEREAPMTTAKQPRSGLWTRAAGMSGRSAAMRSRSVTGTVAVAQLVAISTLIHHDVLIHDEEAQPDAEQP